MTAGAVRKIGFEWALEGKHPGSFDDYELLDHSRRRLDTRIFQEIRSRYVTGISPQLPQVTIARAKTGQDEQVVRYVVLAIQNWSEHRDGTNRRIAHTRWFYVPYEQLIEHPVTYEALYGAFAALPTELDPAAPPTVDVPALDPLTLSPGGDALSTAALLMTGRPVCVVGAERVEMLERLRFLDTVAALLPYGMRANLTATTWISSTAEHRIRLSFARHAPEEPTPSPGETERRSRSVRGRRSSTSTRLRRPRSPCSTSWDRCPGRRSRSRSPSRIGWSRWSCCTAPPIRDTSWNPSPNPNPRNPIARPHTSMASPTG